MFNPKSPVSFPLNTPEEVAGTRPRRWSPYNLVRIPEPKYMASCAVTDVLPPGLVTLGQQALRV